MLTTYAHDPEQHTCMEMRQLMSAPLQAATDANSMMAKAQVRFMLDFCFYQKNEKYYPIMIEMVLKRSFLEAGSESEDKLEEREICFSVPLITLVPFNSLAVETLELEYDIQVISYLDPPEGFNEALGEENVSMEDDNRMRMLGKLTNIVEGPVIDNSENQYTPKPSNRIAVKMKTYNIPLPIGVKAIIDTYSNNITPANTESPTPQP